MPFEEWIRLMGPGIEISGSPADYAVESVSIDTRSLNAGDIFFALKGDRFDGHDFVPQAFQSGAAACVVRNDWSDEENVSDERVLVRAEDTLQALQTLAANYRRRFTIPVLGLTGTNGKTTTKELIASVLQSKFSLTKTPGNLNNHIGTPLSLLGIDDQTEIAVIEMGMNHTGEIAELCEMARPTHGLITNIGEGHLEFFRGIDEVARAKAELFEALPEDGVAFVNADDPRITRMAQIVKDRITYGFTPGCDVSAEELGVDPTGCAKFRLQDQMDIQLRIPGRHQLSNALAAAAVGIHFEIPIERIATALESHAGVSQRMELIEFRNALVILDAYNSNPDSLAGAINTLSLIAQHCGGRAFAALGDMLELGVESERAHREAGELAAQNGVQGIFLFGDQSSFTQHAFKRAGGELAKHFKDKKTLAQAVWETLSENDVVLIKGSRGMQMDEVWRELQELARE
jgi:UDP-N-acetylmuramoyl-tripeptide--D-alanyl-D-alanine ligase